MPVHSGQMFSQYRLERQIGAGGMGVVWKALDTTLKRHVAIKILPSDLTSDPEWRTRFRREAQAAAALDHPNIAIIHEVGEEHDTPFIVMQFLEGRTLRQVIQQGALSLREWLRVSTGVAEGLAHAHKNGIVHRDLKPDNVMLTTDSKIKILDFGLAKMLLSEKPRDGTGPSDDSVLVISRELTQVGKTFGTLAYMSPEQARGDPVDHRSDLFSFGIMLYEMATGQLPFKGRTEVDTLSAIIAREPPPLPEVGSELPAEAERVIRKAIEKEPDRRYQHADEMATDLKNLQRDTTSGRVPTLQDRVTAGQAMPSSSRVLPLWTWALAGIGVVALGAAALQMKLGSGASPGRSGPEGASTAVRETGRKMIVVLPFENLGPAEDEFFAAGMTEEITSRLAAVNGLGVISRKSALQYDGTSKSIKQIGEELGVSYVLGGTVRWARAPGGASRVRITPRLVRVDDDTHLWAEAYDEVFEDIFKVQSEIAGKVIDHLGVALLEVERASLDSRPTENLEAYQAYLRGLHYQRRPEYAPESQELQMQMFIRAVQLDPRFALAFAALSRTHSGFYHFGYDRTPERQSMARSSVDRALELAPDSPEVQLALGYYHYWCHKDYQRALEAFAAARRSLPNDSELLEAVAYVQRRQGVWEETTANLKRACTLSPLEARPPAELGRTYTWLRRYQEAEEYLDRSIAILPDQVEAYLAKAENYWLWKGTTREARAALEALPKTGDPSSTWFRFWQEVYDRRFEEALDLLRATPDEMIREQFFFAPKALLAAVAHDLMGDAVAARAAYGSARVELEEEIRARPDDHRPHSALGLVLAGLGKKDEAVAEGRRAVAMYPTSADAMAGPPWIGNLALIYAMVGEQEAAIDQIEVLLSIPSRMSVPFLQLDPRWDPLRDHARFRKLVTKS